MGCSCRGSSSPASLHTSTPFSPQSPKKAQQKKKKKKKLCNSTASSSHRLVYETPHNWKSLTQTFVLSPWKGSCSQGPTPGNAAGTDLWHPGDSQSGNEKSKSSPAPGVLLQAIPEGSAWANFWDFSPPSMGLAAGHADTGLVLAPHALFLSQQPLLF